MAAVGALTATGCALADSDASAEASLHPYSPAPPHPYHPPAAPGVGGYGYTPRPYPPAPYGPTHGPPAHGTPDYGGPPLCSKNSSDLVKNYCLVDHEYPVYEIQHAVEYHYSAVAALYKVQLAIFKTNFYLCCAQ